MLGYYLQEDLNHYKSGIYLDLIFTYAKCSLATEPTIQASTSTSTWNPTFGL
jgi:hypothetical protein